MFEMRMVEHSVRSVATDHRGYTADIAQAATTLDRAAKGLKRIIANGWRPSFWIAVGASDAELASLREDRQARFFNEHLARTLSLRAA